MLRSEEQQIRDGVAVPPESFNPTRMSPRVWCPVVRCPRQLRLHPALDELGWSGGIDEFNEAALLTNMPVNEPLLITTGGIILAGIGRWRAAIFDAKPEINCIEYPVGNDEALQFIIRHHQPHHAWNPFIRICLALKLEPYFQKRALDNMRAGGKYKGLAKLPKAQHIDARQEIANSAGPGAGARNVGNVKTILQAAHPRLIKALTDGNLSINCAVPWCKLPKAQQVEQFINYLWERATQKVIRQAIGGSKKDESNPDFRAVIDMLQRQEAQQPGSVMLRCPRLQRTVIVIGQDLLAGPYSQNSLKLA
jgi:hypothetical protein